MGRKFRGGMWLVTMAAAMAGTGVAAQDTDQAADAVTTSEEVSDDS